MYPSSVVQTGVKSLGWEKRTAHPSPIHSWKLRVPCEVSAVKLGASSFMRNIVVSFWFAPKTNALGTSGTSQRFLRGLITIPPQILRLTGAKYKWRQKN